MGIVKYFRQLGFLILLGMLVCLPIGTAGADDSATLERLEKIIQQQQRQIEALQKQVGAMQADVVKVTESVSEAPSQKFLQTGNDKAQVTLYGQVNRGVLYTDDGDDTTLYQVDNDNSSTRIGLKGHVKGSEALEVGTKIELQFESNSSSAVNQDNKTGVGPNNFTKRHLDLYLASPQYGKLSIGFGSTASDTTSETDFSGTTVVGYSGIADMAGGQFFYDNISRDYDRNADNEGTTKVGDAFTNMDGLGRDERLRYDTPSFYNFSVATSYISDGGGDLALRYSDKFDSFKLAAAVAYANPGGRSDKTDYQLSSSVSALHDSGISLTLAGGQREYKTDTAGDGVFFYTKLGYQTDLFSVGKSAFSLDYGFFDDIAQNNDEATTFGAQFVQNFTDWGTEYYLGYRLYQLDRDLKDYEDISAILSGFRVKF